MLKKIAGFGLSLFIFFLVLFLLLKGYDYFKTTTIKENRFSRESVFKLRLDKIKVPKAFSFNNTASGTEETKKVKDGKLIYHVTYHLDPYSMRETDLEDKWKASEHLVLGGCSFTFGEGLSQDETISQMMENEDSRYNNYNLGVMGGGLQTLIHFSDVVDLKEYIKEKDGVFLYLFISDHLSRWYARPSYLMWASDFHPHYQVIDKKVVFSGLLGSTQVYKDYKKAKDMGLENSYLRMRNYLKNKNEWTEKELSDFSYAVSFFKERYLKIFPKGKFIFLIHGLSGLREMDRKFLKKFLTKLGVIVWDGHEDFERYILSQNFKSPDFVIEGDGHPNARFNQYFSEYILQRLKSKD